MPISPLLTVLCLLHCRARAVGTGYILFLFRLGLNLIVLLRLLPAASEVNAIDEEIIVIAHCSLIEIRI